MKDLFSQFETIPSIDMTEDEILKTVDFLIDNADKVSKQIFYGCLPYQLLSKRVRHEIKTFIKFGLLTIENKDGILWYYKLDREHVRLKVYGF